MANFNYVYILKSIPYPNQHYVGLTNNIKHRLQQHNNGDCIHTTKHLPWKLETAIAFDSRIKAAAFEKYLKSHSGRAFAKKHF